MKTLTTLFATLVIANAAIAAPAASSQAGGSAAVAAVQSVTIHKSRSRSEVRAEAVDAVKHRLTTLAIQLAQYQ